MPVPDSCPDCGGERAAGICPRCLIRLGMDGPGLSLSGSHGPGVIIPIGDEVGRASVLETLAQTIGPVPRVLLRDTAKSDVAGPIVQVKSPEMPEVNGPNGRLQLLGEIARGGMGAVLKGRDNDLGRDLAVKVLLERHGDDPELLRRFVEEAQIAGQLQHPGIVPVYELGTFADRRPYFAMKLVKGRTLAEVMAERHDPTGDHPRLLAIFLDVAQTMAYAHARGVIHRDLKPSNIMVGSFGEVQVMDWGLAKVLARGGVVDDRGAGKLPPQETIITTGRSDPDSDLERSQAGSVLGTPSYMAPEQARGENEGLDERSDVFALGSILCEILTGLPAFTGRTSGEILRRATRGDLTDAHKRLIACGADAELVALARNALAAEADDRPTHAGTIADRLTTHFSGVQERLRAAELTQAAESARAEEEVKRRRVTIALAASLLTMAGLVAGGWSWAESRRVRREAVTGREVNLALAQAAELRGRSRATAAGDSALLELALAQAGRGASLLSQGEGDADLRSRVETTLTALNRELKEARERFASADRDRRMIERLEAIRAYMSNNSGYPAMDKEYEQAFRDYDIDVESLAPNEAGARIASRTNADALIESLDQWIFTRRRLQNKATGIKRLIAVANAADPDPWRKELRDSLDRDDYGVLRRLAATANLDRIPKESLSRLAGALWHGAGELEASLRLLHAAQRRYRDDYWVNYDLTCFLIEAKPPRAQEALPYAMAAAAIQPNRYLSYINLGWIYVQLGNIEGAIFAYREVLRINPDSHDIRNLIVDLLRRSGRTDEADAESRKAIRIKRLDPGFHQYLGQELSNQGKFDEAIAAYRESLRLRPDSALVHFQLALSYLGEQKYDEAIGPLREAVRLDGDHLGSAVWILGDALCRLDRFDEAVKTYRLALEAVDAQPADVARVNAMIAEAGRRMAVVGRLNAYLKGEAQPKDAAEAFRFATVLNDRGRHVAAVGLFARVFAADPKLGDDLETYSRYNAACSAALSGCGKGKDAPSSNDDARVKLRDQALGWLKADLALHATMISAGTTAGGQNSRKALDRWKIDPDLTGIRDANALAKLPKAEQADWKAFWNEVDALITKTAPSPPAPR